MTTEQHPPNQKERRRRHPLHPLELLWALLDVLSIPFVVMLLAVGLSFSATVVQLEFTRPREATIEARIQTLANSLENAASIITEIEAEIDKRMGLVSELEELALHKPQAGLPQHRRQTGYLRVVES